MGNKMELERFFLKKKILMHLNRIAQWYSAGLDDRGFESRQGLGIFLLTTASRPALGPTQPPVQWVPGALSLGVKWPGREADHLPPSSAEVKDCMELYLHSPNTPLWRGVQLKKHRDNFNFTLPPHALYAIAFVSPEANVWNET
jgi:hypothetical protein